MGHQGRWQKWWSAALVAAGLLGVSGCLNFMHPVAPPPEEARECCRSLPRCCRDHVYVFLINGLDPFGYGNLYGAREYLTELGWTRTYYGQMYNLWEFAGEIRRLHREDPDAHFVVVGFSLGVNLADVVAWLVNANDIHLDLLVFLSGNHPLWPMPSERPPNVDRVVNILASGLMATRGERDYAENLRLAGTMHFDPPTHPETLELLNRELTQVAQKVPVSEPEPPALPPGPRVPTPRPVKGLVTARGGEWDFLKPADHLARMPDEDLNPAAAVSPSPAPLPPRGIPVLQGPAENDGGR